MQSREPWRYGPPPGPGDVLRTDYIAGRGLTQDRLAAALGVSRITVNQLLNDRRNVTAEMALRLSRVLGTTPEFWLDLQRDLDLYRAHRKRGDEIAALVPLAQPVDGPPLATLASLFPPSET